MKKFIKKNKLTKSGVLGTCGLLRPWTLTIFLNMNVFGGNNVHLAANVWQNGRCSHFRLAASTITWLEYFGQFKSFLIDPVQITVRPIRIGGYKSQINITNLVKLKFFIQLLTKLFKKHQYLRVKPSNFMGLAFKL